jgi:CDP-diacylglycerol--serine O-phosphatidyltransferase
MNLRKTFFILPNLFTLASLFCGFFAIATVGSGVHASSTQLYQAAIAICFGCLFDASDGRVARLTKTQSALGLQLDSLADLVTFGVAPAMIMYRWGLERVTTGWPHVGKFVGLFIAFLFVACAALRLARFNVLALKESEDKKGPGRYILGLPVPCAAAVLMGLVGANYQLGNPWGDAGELVLAAIVIGLACLMVSRVRFRSFKDVRMTRRTVMAVAGFTAAALLAVVWKKVPSSFVFVGMMGAYVGLGLFEGVLFLTRRGEAPATATSDEEVLAELVGEEDGEGDDEAEAPALNLVTKN